MHGRHEQQKPVLSRMAVVMLAAVSAFVVSSLLAGQLLGSDSREPGPTSQNSANTAQRAQRVAESTPISTRSTPSQSERDQAAIVAAVELCRLANLRQQAALYAAAVSLSQWQKHIDAMNLLVAGKISLSVARTFWEQTRVAATENAAAFRAADAGLSKDGVVCPEPDVALASAESESQAQAIAGCAAALSARSPVLGLARKGVSTWEHHIHEMEMLRSGEVTPAQAAAAWLKSWKAGDRQMKAYEAGVKDAARAAQCTLT